ncbi:GNAT domain-containing protein [Aspergillus navahoensis]
MASTSVTPTAKNSLESPNPGLNISFQTARLSFKPLCLTDTPALHELRTESEVMKWSVQKVPDASLQQTEDWIRAWVSTDTYPSTSGSDPEYEGEGVVKSNQSNKNRTKSKQKGLCFSVRELAHIQSSEKEEGPRQDRIVATVGIKEAESPITKRLQYELGYMFVPRVWGKGYASEAVKGIVRWWFEYLDSFYTLDSDYSKVSGGDGGEGDVAEKDRIYAIVSKTNGASLRVLEKCGFRVVGEGREDDGTGDGLELVEFCISRSDLTRWRTG